MTDKKFKVGDKVRQTGPSEMGFTDNIGQIGIITKMHGPCSADVDWQNGKDNAMPITSLEHVNKPQAACILTEKVTINGVPCRKILGFEGILTRDELPKKYLESKPRFIFCANTLNHVRLWDGKRFVYGAAMAESGHVDLDVPEDDWIKGTCNIMFKGDVWTENHFQEFLTWLRRAGSRLAKIRKQERDAWSGKETIEI